MKDSYYNIVRRREELGNHDLKRIRPLIEEVVNVVENQDVSRESNIVTDKDQVMHTESPNQ